MDKEKVEIKETNIREFLRPILLHKIGFFVIFFLFVGLAILYITITSPVYRADALLEIKEVEQKPTSDIILSALSGGSVVNLDTEIDYLKSRYMISKALNHIDYKVSYYQHNGLKKLELYKSSPFKVKILAKKDNLIYGTPIYIKVNSPDSFELYYGGSILSNLGITDSFTYKKEHKFGENIDIGSAILRIEKKGDIQNGIYSFTVNNKLGLIGKFSSNLQVYKTSKDSYLVKIVYHDNVPLRAKEFVNALADEYIKQTIKNKTLAAEQKLNFINEQLQIINENLKNSEVQLENFKKQNRLVDFSTEVNTIITKLSQFDTKLAELEVKERLINELYNTVIENGVEQISPTAFGIQDTVLISLIDRLNQAIEKKKELLSEYTELHPDVQKTNEKIDSIRASIKSSIVSLKNEVKNQKEAIKSIIARYDNILRNLPSTEREFINLKRRYLVNEKIYSYLLEKKVEASIAKAAVVANNKVVDYAVLPSSPVKPKKPIILAIGILVGLMLGSFYGYVREFLDDSVKTKEDIERLSTIPVIGIIPKISKRKLKKNILSFREQNSVFAEAIRKIRANLQFLSPEDKKGKKILITSTVGDEGKTTLAVNLAPILSFADKKVVLLDLDMRKPKVNEYFNINTSEGITDVLIGRRPLSQVIKKTAIKNLDVIPVGKIPPNPGDMLVSKKLQEILKELEEKYDFIVIDSPPIGLVADTILLMKDMDVSLIVVRAGYSKRIFIKNTDKLVKDYNIKNVGYVLNYVKPSEIYYGYGYGY